MTEDNTDTPAGLPRYVERVPAGQRTTTPKPAQNAAAPKADPATVSDTQKAEEGKVKELGGPKGPEPTRFGDWERDGRCVDF